MAQMAPALAEAAGSPSPNGNISSSSVQNPLREPYIEEGIRIDNSKAPINSTTSNHNGFCRSMANTNLKSAAGKRVFDEVHKLNNLPRAFHNASETAKSGKLNTLGMSPPTCVENRSVSEQTGQISSKKEALFSTPTRIQITTTKTCAPNSLENRSSCQAPDNKTYDESQQRHLFPCPEPSPRLLYGKRAKKIALNQTRISARAHKLERKLRTLQSRQLEVHVTEQLQTFALNRRKTQQGFPNQKQDQVKHDLTLRQPSSSTQVKEETLSEPSFKSVGRVGEEPTSNALSGQNNASKHAGLVENNLRTDCGNIVKPSDKETEGNSARSLVCQLELAEHVGDSDATESSSGAESSDEMDYNTASTESKAKGLPSHLNQFYSDRGSIASKWTWLRSQVIDIERRIRRCEETYKAVRVKKTSIQLEKPKLVDNNVIVSMANKSANDLLIDTANMLNNRKHHPDLNSSITNSSMTSENVFPRNSGMPMLTEKEKTNLLLNVQKCSVQHDSDHVNSCTAARTRSVQQWQRRKLFNLSKIQKPSSSVLCGCGNSWTPCVLCKRSSPNLPRFTQRQDLRDRVSLVDLSFHPVLSFETEVPLSLHFGALLKKGNFQSKIFKLNPPNADSKAATKRKYVRSASSPAAIKKKERKEAMELSYKKQGIRDLRDRKNNKKAGGSSKNDRVLRQKSRANKKRSAAVNAGLRLANQLQKRARSLSLPSGSSRPSSPVSNTPSPTSFGNSFLSNSLSEKKKKPTSNAFDINNIVIPYSMASTTRVEKLQYKEILTPAWREMAVTPKEQTSDVKMETDEEVEDLSNLSFALRHLKCEENERKRFVGLAIKKKKRSIRQNSEATTPEPVSPGSLLFDGHLTASRNSSGVPSPTSSNPSLNSSLNITSPTGLSGAVVNMLSSDSMPSKLERSGKSTRHHSRRNSHMEHNEDSNEAWPVVTPWTLRNFPLTDVEIDHLNNPPPTPRFPLSVPPSPTSSRTASPILSPVDSPDSTAAANWTVKVLTPETANNTESDSKPPRKGIVLKLAKR